MFIAPKARVVCLGLCALVFLPVLRSKASIGHAIDVMKLVEVSDVVLVGRVTAITEQGPSTIDTPSGPMPSRTLLAVLKTDEALKGSTETPSVAVEFRLPEAPSGIRGITAGQYGIFFLTKQSSSYRVSDPYYPFLPVVPSTKVSSGTPLDQVIARLGETLSYEGSSEFEVASALDALATIPRKSATDALVQALTTAEGDLRLRIASRLVASNNISGLDIVEEALTHPAGLSDYLFANLAGSLGGLKDPRAVPALERLLKTNDPRVVKGASIALRQSGSADALEPLSQLLTNGDEQVRYYAVVALGEITKQDQWTPAFDEFHDHEAKYLLYWRDWAASNLPAQPRR